MIERSERRAQRAEGRDYHAGMCEVEMFGGSRAELPTVSR
jgi:hypothetical protein